MSACVVVVSYRTGASLSGCLSSLRVADGVDQIVIVDNGNPPVEAGAIDTLASEDARVRVMRGQGNIGFAAGCNLGAQRASADVLVFLNPDVVLESDAVADLKSVLSATPIPAIVGGDLRDDAGRPERGSRRDRVTLWRALVAFSGLCQLERFSPLFRDFNRHNDPVPNAPVEVGAISGALMALRRKDFETLGGFDEGYFIHVEDLDICRRAEERGWSVIFAPGPHGRHVRSTSAVESAFVAKHKARGMAYYLEKFARGPIARVVAWCAGRVLILVSR